MDRRENWRWSEDGGVPVLVDQVKTKECHRCREGTCITHESFTQHKFPTLKSERPRRTITFLHSTHSSLH